jgi:flagellar biosynthesis protein FlhF
MRVKKFEAKSMKEALQMVKKELGPDAVILSARDNRKSFGIAGEASVEITAAVSESTLQKKNFVESRFTTNDRERFQNSDARTQRRVIQEMVDGRVRAQEEEVRKVQSRNRPITSMSYIDIEDDEQNDDQVPRRTRAFENAKGRSVDDLLNAFNQDFPKEQRQAPARQPVQRSAQTQSPRQAPQQQPQPAKRTAVAQAESAMARVREAAREAFKNNSFFDEPAAPPARQAAPSQASNGLETYSSPAPAAASAIQAQTENAEIGVLKGEIDRLHKVLESFQKVPQSFTTMHPGADYGISYDLSFMFQKLTEAGVAAELAAEILKTAGQQIDPIQLKKRPIVDAWVARYFLQTIKVNPTPWQGRLHLFVGGAGSGKTTSLVKMAAHLVVKEKKRVAVLSTDSTKVGAVDQMKIYCQILNVPFAVVRNKNDWEWIFGQLKNVDHILVDFPGLQLRDLDEIHSLKALLPPDGFAPITHLCVSATSKDGDAEEMSRRYKVAEPQDLVFTNLDQSAQHGLIYNLQRRTGLPLHSFGIGHRVPEDFEAASKERVLDLIFKLTKLKRENA